MSVGSGPMTTPASIGRYVGADPDAGARRDFRRGEISVGAGIAMLVAGQPTPLRCSVFLPSACAWRRSAVSLALPIGETIMDEEALNISVRKFLKKLGVTAQRESRWPCARLTRKVS